MGLEDAIFILIAGFGAFCQEIMYLIELRKKLQDDRLKDLLSSNSFWLILVLVISISGFGTWVLYGGKELSNDLIFLLGAAFPVIFKKLVTSFGQLDTPNLGANVVKNYFLLLSHKK